MRLPLFPALLLLLTPIALQAQWQLQDAHTTADLRGIHSLGNGIAWASGTNGTVLRTEDAGFVWQLCAIPPNAEHLDFRAIQAFDNNIAIVMSSGKGDLSRLYKTTDGCQTWTLLFTNPEKDGFWDALDARQAITSMMSFCSDGSPGAIVGAILGDPSLHRSNMSDITRRPSFYLAGFTAGLTCPEATLLPSASSIFSVEPREGAFAASNSTLLEILPNTHWIAVRQRLIQYTRGVGAKASVQCDMAVPLGSSSESSGVFSVALRPDSVEISMRTNLYPELDPKKPRCLKSDLVAVGGDHKFPDRSQATAAYTGGGRSFKVSQTPPHGYRSAVAYDPTHQTWITVGPNGTDISTDDGRDWRPLNPNAAAGDPPDADQHWNALSLPFVVGPHGRIATLRPDALPIPSPKRP